MHIILFIGDKEKKKPGRPKGSGTGTRKARAQTVKLNDYQQDMAQLHNSIGALTSSIGNLRDEIKNDKSEKRKRGN